MLKLNAGRGVIRGYLFTETLFKIVPKKMGRRKKVPVYASCKLLDETASRQDIDTYGWV
jgi:hypothetical protein